MSWNKGIKGEEYRKHYKEGLKKEEEREI